jgi:exodeoxyribonuclease III
MGYEHYWYPAQKKGYSGTAIFTRKSPIHVEYGCGHEDYDFEGRTIRADFDDLSVMSVYFPSGTTGDIRQDFKYRFLDDFQSYVNQLKVEKPNLVVCGDFNICHRAIEIHTTIRGGVIVQVRAPGIWAGALIIIWHPCLWPTAFKKPVFCRMRSIRIIVQ